MFPDRCVLYEADASVIRRPTNGVVIRLAPACIVAVGSLGADGAAGCGAVW